MKIALVTSELVSVHERFGGIGSHFDALSRSLAARGHEVTVLTSSLGARASYQWPVDAAPSLVMLESLAPRHPLYPIETAARYDRFLRHHRFEVVFAPEWGGWLAKWATRRDRGLLVTNLATSTRQTMLLERARPADLSERATMATSRSLERVQTRRSDAVVAISKALLGWTKKLWGSLPPSTVIPNGLDIGETLRLASSSEADPLLAEIVRGRPTVMTTGRICRWKGSFVLLDAMRAVWREHPDVVVVFIGAPAGDEARVLMSTVRTDPELRDRVVFTGHLPRGTLLGTLAHADIAAFPSLFEGFGNGCLEAKALGLPVVATSGSGFAEFCTDGVDALLVPPDDSGALANALRRLLDAPTDAEALGAEAAVRAQQYDSVVNAARLERFFEALLTR